MQIRYLESMASMARNSGQKTIFMPTSDDAKTHFHVADPSTTSGASSSALKMPTAAVAGADGSQQFLSYQHTGKN